MSTLIYTPKVIVRIRTSPNSRGKGRVIDVSEDITQGSVTRVTNGVSNARITLLNQNRKYDGMFSPMDAIVVHLRRLRPVLKFSGYLDSVPKWAAEPGSIDLAASCTMKRLQHFLWDPTTPAALALMNTEMPGWQQMHDGGAAKRAIQLLTEVGGWDRDKIHISRIPDNWYDRVGKIADQLIGEAEALQMANAMGSGSWIKGNNYIERGKYNVDGIGAGTGYLPAERGRISHFGGPNGGAYGKMALTGESGTNPNDDWYVAMRWPYTDVGAVKGAKQWWVNRKILVVNPATQNAVVLRAADWGPAANTKRVIDVSPRALRALGASTDDIVHITFAPDGVNLGPLSAADAELGGGRLSTEVGSTQSGNSSAITTGWGAAGDTSNIVAAKAGGISFQVHRLARRRFEGFVNDLVSKYGYQPKSIGGYNNRNIGGTSKKSNHAWGAAIDIDPSRNPYYANAKGGKHALPTNGLVELARKWGLGWGGEWQNSKDYMHFEVIGAPASSTYEGVGPGGGTTTTIKKWKPPLTPPLNVTARFGDRGSMWSLGYHTGTDFSAPEGTNIYPVGPGKVNRKGTDASYGNYISIDHGGGHYTFYAHMDAPSGLLVGDSVGTGTRLGGVGATGNVTGAHLHLEYRKGEDTFSAAASSGGIEKYILGGSRRADPPSGVLLEDGEFAAEELDLGASEIGQGLFNVFLFNLQAQTSVEGQMLGGQRALMNDEPLSQSVASMMTVAGRDWCSAPNGDFIGWFPDYFGHYGQAGKMVVTSLEIDGVAGPPTVGWSDERLKTHQFVSSATSFASGDASHILRTYTTAGIASIEQPELMMALLNISEEEAVELREYYLQRYGPRVEFTPMNNISGARQEFFYACHLFQKNWADQYQARVGLMFVPELFPGMLMCLPEYGIQGYVQSTTDSFDLRGGGFSTSVSCSPWSSLGRNGLPAADGLPIGAEL